MDKGKAASISNWYADCADDSASADCRARDAANGLGAAIGAARLRNSNQAAAPSSARPTDNSQQQRGAKDARNYQKYADHRQKDDRQP